MLVLGIGLIAWPHRLPQQGHDVRTLWRLARGLRACPLPAPDSLWARDVREASVDPRSARWIATLGPDAGLHADFGGDAGVPVQTVSWLQPMQTLDLVHVGNSDDVGYPIDDDLLVERATRAHPQRAVLWDPSACLSWELIEPQREAAGWSALRAERVDLRAGPRDDSGWKTLRPNSGPEAPWHDGSGVPLLPLLARTDEVRGQAIGHALHLGAPNLQRAYVAPARWAASPVVDPDRPPMGARLRLRADFDCGALAPQSQRLCEALQIHGAFLAESGARVELAGELSADWDRADLATLREIRVADLEVLTTGPATVYGLESQRE